MSQARRTRHCARSARGGEEKNKAPVTSPLFWLFLPPTPTDGGDVKRTNQIKTRSITQTLSSFWLPETRTTAYNTGNNCEGKSITFNNVRLTVAKDLLSQSLVMSKHSGEKEKRETCFPNKFQGHELMSRVWLVNT